MPRSRLTRSRRSQPPLPLRLQSTPRVGGGSALVIDTRVMIIVGILMYFGALIIPAGYLMSTRWRGAAKRPMLIGTGLQLFWSLAVWALVYFSWRAGHTDAYMGWAFQLPVNVVGLLYFWAVLFIYARKARK